MVWSDEGTYSWFYWTSGIHGREYLACIFVGGGEEDAVTGGKGGTDTEGEGGSDTEGEVAVGPVLDGGVPADVGGVVAVDSKFIEAYLILNFAFFRALSDGEYSSQSMYVHCSAMVRLGTVISLVFL